MTTGADRRPSPLARGLGFGGLIPFVTLAGAVWLGPADGRAFVGTALLGYAAIIVSFLGAIHWGLAMQNPAQPAPLLVWGVLPSLLGWGALLLGPGPGLALIAALLWVCFAVDRAVYPQYRLQGWLAMRLALTLVASGSCLAAAAGLGR